MSVEKNIREAARVVRVLLDKAGYKLRVKDVQRLIQEEDLSDLVALTARVHEVLENDPNAKTNTASDRRKEIATFCAENKELLNNNKVIRDGLFHLYSMGRYNKEQRAEFKRELESALAEEQSEELEF